MAYCDLCRRYFFSEESRQQHLSNSPAHFVFECSSCDRDFVNYQAWANHMNYSSRHNYCFACERDFSTANGLDQHLQYDLAHADVTRDSDYSNDWNAQARRDTDTDSDDSDDDHSYFFQQAMQRITPRSPTPPLPSSSSSRLTERSSNAIDSTIPTERVVIPTSSIAPANTVTANLDNANTSGQKALGLALCPVCFESKSDVTATACGHVFCTICIHQALRHKHECPVCRKSALPNDLRRLYLSS